MSNREMHECNKDTHHNLQLKLFLVPKQKRKNKTKQNKTKTLRNLGRPLNRLYTNYQ